MIVYIIFARFMLIPRGYGIFTMFILFLQCYKDNNVEINKPCGNNITLWEYNLTWRKYNRTLWKYNVTLRKYILTLCTTM